MNKTHFSFHFVLFCFLFWGCAGLRLSLDWSLGLRNGFQTKGYEGAEVATEVLDRNVEGGEVVCVERSSGVCVSRLLVGFRDWAGNQIVLGACGILRA